MFKETFAKEIGREFCWARNIKNMIQEIRFKIRLCNQLIVN